MVRVCSIRDIECTRGCTNVCQREFDELKDKAYAAGVAAGKERENFNALKIAVRAYLAANATEDGACYEDVVRLQRLSV